MKVTVDTTIHAPANTLSMITSCASDADYLVPRQPQPLPTCQKTKPRLALRIPILTKIRIRIALPILFNPGYNMVIVDYLWTILGFFKAPAHPLVHKGAAHPPTERL